MKTMRPFHTLYLLLLLTGGFVFSACQKDNDRPTKPASQTYTATLSIRQDCEVINPEDGTTRMYYVLVAENGQSFSVANPALIDALKPVNGQRICFTVKEKIGPRQNGNHQDWGWCGTPPGIAPGGCICEPDVLDRLVLGRAWLCDGDCAQITMSNAKPNTQIQSAWIDGNCLAINVHYGGCRQRSEQFRLHWDGNIRESLPTQVDFYLEDQMLNDIDCMMLVSDTLRFDLSPLGGALPSQISVGGKQVIYQN